MEDTLQPVAALSMYPKIPHIFKINEKTHKYEMRRPADAIASVIAVWYGEEKLPGWTVIVSWNGEMIQVIIPPLYEDGKKKAATVEQYEWVDERFTSKSAIKTFQEGLESTPFVMYFKVLGGVFGFDDYAPDKVVSTFESGLNAMKPGTQEQIYLFDAMQGNRWLEVNEMDTLLDTIADICPEGAPRGDTLAALPMLASVAMQDMRSAISKAAGKPALSRGFIMRPVKNLYRGDGSRVMFKMEFDKFELIKTAAPKLILPGR